MKKIILTVAALAMLSACSTTPADPWIGRSEDEVIARLGLPMRTYKSTDRKYIVYDLSRKSTSGYTKGSYIVSGCGYVSPLPYAAGCSSANACRTMFVLDDGTVEDWRTTGRCGY